LKDELRLCTQHIFMAVISCALSLTGHSEDGLPDNLKALNFGLDLGMKCVLLLASSAARSGASVSDFSSWFAPKVSSTTHLRFLTGIRSNLLMCACNFDCDEALITVENQFGPNEPETQSYIIVIQVQTRKGKYLQMRAA
jgi:hypothetical protein